MTDRLGRLLLVTVEAARVNADLPMLAALRSWLDSWRGIDAVERGMAQQGFDLQLIRREWSTRPRARWAPLEPMPWRAVQGAALDALRKSSSDA